MADDWYKVVSLAPGCFGIGEPRYEQQNWSYLIEGAERALLFDTGSFCADITPVVARLTEKPVTALPSHMHYDHLGNVHRFGEVHLPDLPVLRACERGGVVTPSEELFLGHHENRSAPGFAVARWLPLGREIDLGGVALRLMHTPGHSPDSVSLWWEAEAMLFAADYLYPGPLYAQVPGASVAAYLATARALLGWLPEQAALLGAHGDAPDAARAQPPRLGRGDLAALERSLAGLIADPPEIGDAPVTLPISPRLEMILAAEALDRPQTG
ncbi:MAG: MBL fold metallo-hydrolase [Roseovarius sp.]